jgi:hypothetical protein
MHDSETVPQQNDGTECREDPWQDRKLMNETRYSVS